MQPNERTVAFPVRERATAFIPEDGVPFRRATVGITYPFADYRIRRSASHSITLFEYVLEGQGEVLVNGVWRRAEAGDVYILPAGEAHEYRADQGKPWKKIWVNYVADYIGHLLSAYRVAPGVYHAKEARRSFEELLSLADLAEQSRKTDLRIAALIHGIVETVARCADRGGEEEGDEYRLHTAIASKVYERFSLDQLAEELHLSKSQIIRSFKKLYGTTPYSYLLGLKLDVAKILLRDTGMKIKEISDRLAISDEHYFSATFRQRVGISPREYRIKKQNKTK